MARRFDLIVFDWDGTLMDSAGAIVAAIFAACEDLDLEAPSPERARHIIGLGLHDALRWALPQLDAAEYPVVAERYRHHYLSRDHELELFPGARDVVEYLHADGRWLGVATGKSRLGLERALASSGVGGFFHATRCADECFSKPHPAMLLEIMALLDIAPDRALMVGDTTHDLQMARNAGVCAIAMTHGAHPRAELMQEVPLACLADFAELGAWLREHG
ncbi:MAG: HAD-IA family hydrolase [Rhodocyclaceae bacterium]|jgi:phosphoglycolate phosphatase